MSAAAHGGLAVENHPRVWYNSQLTYSHFMVLSMIALAGMMVGVITAAAGIVREKESGTIEQLLVTPARPAELVAAKMAPPLIVGLVALFPSLVIAALVGAPLRGSLLLFVLFSAVFLLSSMGIGILVATITDTLQQALLVSFLVLFPVLFLSGTLVPLEHAAVAPVPGRGSARCATTWSRCWDSSSRASGSICSGRASPPSR